MEKLHFDKDSLSDDPKTPILTPEDNDIPFDPDSINIHTSSPQSGDMSLRTLDSENSHDNILTLESTEDIGNEIEHGRVGNIIVDSAVSVESVDPEIGKCNDNDEDLEGVVVDGLGIDFSSDKEDVDMESVPLSPVKV